METTPRSGEPFNFSQEVGKGFLFGSVCSTAFLFAKGGIQAVWVLAPGASCYGAAWWGTYSAIKHARRKKDAVVFNNALAMAAAYGVTSLPNGIRAAGRSSLLGGAAGVILGGGLKLLLEYPPRNLSPQQADQ